MIGDGNYREDQDPYSFETPPSATMPTGPVTSDSDPRLTNPQHASDPEVLDYVNKQLAAIQVANGNAGTPNTPDWQKYIDAAGGSTPTPTTTNPGPTSTPPGRTPVDPGGLIVPFDKPYNPYQPKDIPTLGPIAGAPLFPSIPKFKQPTIEEAMADPGYKFTLDQGNNNLTNWAAARGTLNDSATGKAFIDYGQNAATTQYGNVWDRDFKAYDSDVNTQYLQPWQAAFQNWSTGTVGPTVENFKTQAQNTQHLNDLGFQDNWNKWLQDWNIFRDQRDSTFNKKITVATA